MLDACAQVSWFDISPSMITWPVTYSQLVLIWLSYSVIKFDTDFCSKAIPPPGRYSLWNVSFYHLLLGLQLVLPTKRGSVSNCNPTSPPPFFSISKSQKKMFSFFVLPPLIHRTHRRRDIYPVANGCLTGSACSRLAIGAR